MKTGAKCISEKSLLKLDSYGTPISLNYSDGSSEYKTVSGSCFSALVTLLTLIYLANNLYLMGTYSKSTLSTTLVESGFADNETFTSKNGFRIAFGLFNEKIYGDEFEDYLELEAHVLYQDWIKNQSI